jgi:hypothetical protein
VDAFAACDVGDLIRWRACVGVYGRPRTTKDLDPCIQGGENLESVGARSLAAFGLPATFVEASRNLGERDGFFCNAPSSRLDLLRGIEGLAFGEAHARAVRIRFAVGLTEPMSVSRLVDLITSPNNVRHDRVTKAKF